MQRRAKRRLIQKQQKLKKLQPKMAAAIFGVAPIVALHQNVHADTHQVVTNADNDFDQEVLRLVNKVRAYYGLAPAQFSATQQAKSLEKVNNVTPDTFARPQFAHKYGQSKPTYSENEKWGNLGLTARDVVVNWFSENGVAPNVMGGVDYSKGHSESMLTASQLGGAMMMYNGTAVYVMSYDASTRLGRGGYIDPSDNVKAIADKLYHNEALINQILDGTAVNTPVTPSVPNTSDTSDTTVQPSQPTDSATTEQPVAPAENPTDTTANTDNGNTPVSPDATTPTTDATNPADANTDATTNPAPDTANNATDNTATQPTPTVPTDANANATDTGDVTAPTTDTTNTADTNAGTTTPTPAPDTTNPTPNENTGNNTPDITYETLAPVVEPEKPALSPDDLVSLLTKETRQVSVPFETVVEEDPTLYVGNNVVVQVGQNGIIELNEQVTTKDGKEVKREVIDTKVVKASVKQIERRGTKAPIVNVIDEQVTNNTSAKTLPKTGEAYSAAPVGVGLIALALFVLKKKAKAMKRA